MAVSLLLLLLKTVHEKCVSFCNSTSEVLTVREQLLEVHDIFVQKHTGNSWSVLFTISLLDDSKDVVSNKVVPICTLKLIQLLKIDLRKLDLRKVSCWSLVSLLCEP